MQARAPARATVAIAGGWASRPDAHTPNPTDASSTIVKCASLTALRALFNLTSLRASNRYAVSTRNLIGDQP
jgi:hypothetical protein